jgi:hypothetical protein
MKVVTFKELLEQPVGTIFSGWLPPASVGLFVFKGKLSDTDFTYRSILPECDMDNSDEPGWKMQPCLLTEDDTHNWGHCFPDEDFVVYEKEDLICMVATFSLAYKLVH